MTMPSRAAARQIAAFDPGRNIGYALIDEGGRLLDHCVTDLRGLAELQVPKGSEVVIGAGTGSALLREGLEARGFTVHEVNEYATSLRGRDLWRTHVPARGMYRWLPKGLRAPSYPIDDYAAWAIGLSYLGLSTQGVDAV